MAFYPMINLGALASLIAIRQQMDVTEDYLENSECPYDEDTKGDLRKLLAKEVVEKIIEREKIVEKRVEVAAVAAGGGGKTGPKRKILVPSDTVETELDAILTELKNLKMESKGLQTAERLKIISLRANLVEKLLSMKERINNVKRLSLFQSVVMTILDDLLDDDRRAEFIRRLEPYATAE